MGEASKTSERYEYIDFLRGVAAVGIVAIHTAFWGGESYVPVWFKNMTLFLDVPFFFYLSGWGSSCHKSDIVKTTKSLGTIWLKWIYFVSALTLFCLISKWLPYPFAGVSDVRDLVNNFMLNVSFPGFPVVAGSIWFLQYYFVVVFVNTFFLSLVQGSKTKEERFDKLYMVFLAVAFIWISYGRYALGVDWRYFIFYSFFWMMGRNRVGGGTGKKGQFCCRVVLVMIGIAFTSYLQTLPLYDIQTAKFPPTIKYGFVSLLSILAAKQIEPYVKHTNKWLNHIGRSAIFYYFAQGIGSSLNFHVIPRVHTDNWVIKFLVTFAINLFVTTILAELFRVTYQYVACLLKKMVVKFLKSNEGNQNPCN